MPMHTRFLMLLAALAVPAATIQGRAAADGVEDTARALSEQAIASHVATLAGDDYGGRFPGSAGDRKTVDYLDSQFRSFGLRPVGGDSYRQAVELVTITPKAPPVVVLNGPFGKLQPIAVTDILVSAGRPQVETDVSASRVVFVGFGIVAPEEKWDDYAGVDVTGATVIALWGEPAADEQQPHRFNGEALTHYAMPLEKQKNAALHGAAALLLIHEQEAAGFPWSTLAGQSGKPRLQLRDRAARETPLVQGSLRGDYARDLFQRAGLDLGRLRDEAGRPGFRGRELPKVTANITLRSELAESTSDNVVAMLPGRSRPREHIVLTAHWDHVGIAPAGEGDRIFNGAVDNATGTAVLLELARALAALKPRPERSIVFIATTCEEQGLLGSYYYVRHPLLPLHDTVAALNLDALFPFGETKGMASVGIGQSPDLDALLAKANAAEGRVVLPDLSQFGEYFRSDHYPFARSGVPAIFAVNNPVADIDPTEQADIARWQDYVTTRYHKVGDQYDAATWDLGGLMQDARTYYRVVRWLADSRTWPDWAPESEFRPVHVKRRAGN